MLNAPASICSFRSCSPPFIVKSMPATIRRQNLERLLKERYNGRIAELSRAIQRDDAYVWQLLKGKRNIGERVARDIEIKLDLARGSLDSATLSPSASLTADELELLQRYRQASPTWKLVLRVLANQRGPESGEIPSEARSALAKIANLEPDEGARKAEAGRSRALHQPPAPTYRKKH